MSTVIVRFADLANPFAAEVDDVLIEVESTEIPWSDSFGCGSVSCQQCSPVIYRCEHGVDFPKALINNSAARALDGQGCEHHDVDVDE